MPVTHGCVRLNDDDSEGDLQYTKYWFKSIYLLICQIKWKPKTVKYGHFGKITFRVLISILSVFDYLLFHNSMLSPVRENGRDKKGIRC